jgi:hypothetical protein
MNRLAFTLLLTLAGIVFPLNSSAQTSGELAQCYSGLKNTRLSSESLIPACKCLINNRKNFESAKAVLDYCSSSLKITYKPRFEDKRFCVADLLRADGTRNLPPSVVESICNCVIEYQTIMLDELPFCAAKVKEKRDSEEAAKLRQDIDVMRDVIRDTNRPNPYLLEMLKR